MNTGADVEHLVGRTRAEVAQLLGKSERWVQRQVNAGDLQCSRVGKTPRFTDEHLAAYLQARQPPAPAKPPVIGLVSRRRRAS